MYFNVSAMVRGLLSNHGNLATLLANIVCFDNMPKEIVYPGKEIAKVISLLFEIIVDILDHSDKRNFKNWYNISIDDIMDNSILYSVNTILKIWKFQYKKYKEFETFEFADIVEKFIDKHLISTFECTVKIYPLITLKKAQWRQIRRILRSYEPSITFIEHKTFITKITNRRKIHHMTELGGIKLNIKTTELNDSILENFDILSKLDKVIRICESHKDKSIMLGFVNKNRTFLEKTISRANYGAMSSLKVEIPQLQMRMDFLKYKNKSIEKSSWIDSKDMKIIEYAKPSMRSIRESYLLSLLYLLFIWQNEYILHEFDHSEELYIMDGLLSGNLNRNRIVVMADEIKVKNYEDFKIKSRLYIPLNLNLSCTLKRIFDDDEDCDLIQYWDDKLLRNYFDAITK